MFDLHWNKYKTMLERTMKEVRHVESYVHFTCPKVDLQRVRYCEVGLMLSHIRNQEDNIFFKCPISASGPFRCC